jgi:hypothetical protein
LCLDGQNEKNTENNEKVLDKKGGKAYNLEALEERTCFGRKVKEKHMGM